MIRSSTHPSGARSFFTISRKIAVGYLLMALFSLVAIAAALSGLHQQTLRSQRLVEVEFESLNRLRDLREHLLAQETLGKQYLILQDHSLLDLLNRRRYELDRTWRALAALGDGEDTGRAPSLQVYQAGMDQCLQLLREEQWEAARSCVTEIVAPARAGVLREVRRQIEAQEEGIDRSLVEFGAAGARSYRFTWFLALLGLAVSAPVSVTVVLGLRRSVRALVRATRAFSVGSFGARIDLESGDEFGLLAREFTAMGAKLRELEQASLDANPLTRLPGNLAIDRELEARIEGGEPFAHLYIDLDNFKAFGDRYGYQSGSDAIAWVGDVIRGAVRAHGAPRDLVGHIGGDDYVVITATENAEPIAQGIIETFDRGVSRFYSDEDLQAGFFVGKDRYGVERQIPLLTMSVAVVCSENLEAVSLASIGEECARMKKHLKALPGSNFLIDRRRL
jgi:GGDEF domain-containing protein